MVYGYDTNKEFIDKSYQLLEKLEAKGLWNKDTLIIGLDKSVRPLAYTLRKISEVEGKEKPDMRFFNYSSRDENYSKRWLTRLEKEKTRESLKNYKKILILDDFALSGMSLRNVRDLIKNIEENSNIFFAILKSSPNSKINKDKLQKSRRKLIYEGETAKAKILDGQYIQDKLPEEFKDFNETNFIFVDSSFDSSRAHENNTGIIGSSKISVGYMNKDFLKNRRQLSKDIKNYLHEKHPEKVSKKNKGLERIISGVFVFSFLAGLFLSSNNLTGNVIGSSGTAHKLLGMILVLVGIGGFFVYRKFR